MTDNKLLELIKSHDDSMESSEKIWAHYTSTYNYSSFECFLFVYGSLRRGEYNYDKIREIYGKENFFYVATVTLDYEGMYDYGAYPAVIDTGHHTQNVVAEVMYCSDEVAKAIFDMEIGAGYKKTYATTYINTKSAFGTNICRTLRLPHYVAAASLKTEIEKNKDKFPLIQGGDWIRYNMLAGRLTDKV